MRRCCRLWRQQPWRHLAFRPADCRLTTPPPLPFSPLTKEHSSLSYMVSGPCAQIFLNAFANTNSQHKFLIIYMPCGSLCQFVAPVSAVCGFRRQQRDQALPHPAFPVTLCAPLAIPRNGILRICVGLSALQACVASGMNGTQDKPPPPPPRRTRVLVRRRAHAV